MEQMRSYAAARGYFTFLGFISWCLIIVGVLLVMGGFSLGEAMFNEFGATGLIGLILAIIPGGLLALFGFLCLVSVQVGRAGVDSAELSQQMLKVARDQLDVSRQALSASKMQSASYQGLIAETGAAEGGNGSISSSASKGLGSAASVAERFKALGGRDLGTFPHNGAQLHRGYSLNDQTFGSMAEAVAHAEREVTKLATVPSRPEK